MELHERIAFVMKQKGINQSDLARALGVQSSKISRYFSPDYQNKFRLLLWDIAALWPDVDRNWLFFGDDAKIENMAPQPEKSALTAAQNKISELEADLREERRLNRQLTARLLFDDAQGKKNSTAYGDGDVAAGGQK